MRFALPCLKGVSCAKLTSGFAGLARIRERADCDMGKARYLRGGHLIVCMSSPWVTYLFSRRFSEIEVAGAKI
ncbi:uncharacterized protein BO72DRAFT_449026 [Aspergillus fijiensis CBS 313.89]|uniref:Uncharacterized protein n=1 Tax=Aspergillus fijiensis CBS 313.89 TaxID=1448319 RepID=A0A8G1RRK0_9EURO|nr:uncharacterized protein BO72DRAFT_449026 [Aspergillus fijiensis CBS 313.89]RAK76241.1 hypothetical protein BO72DRAFT_449026 [Aspergillus fijiensis CBS 313.89]